MYDVAIIGAGPAGLTAGLYARRSGYSTIIFEMGVPGGQCSTTDRIDNYPGFPEGIGGSELMMRFYEQVLAYGGEVAFERVEALDLEGDVKRIHLVNSDQVYEARVVILATGAYPQMLRVENEGRFRGKGVSYCATCDGFFFKDKDVCVVGGGDTAVDEALYLANICKSVTLFHRRDALRANKRAQDQILSNDKVHIEWDTVVTSLEGEDRLSKVNTRNVKTNEEKSWDFEGCFVFVGYIPNNKLVPDVIEKDDQGYVIGDEGMATNLPGVYVCGDLRSKRVRQVSTAVGDGGVVMQDVERYLRETAVVDHV